MTSRERILAALNHQEPDRIPIDCGSMRSTGIMGMPYNALKHHLGINTGSTKMYDMVQQLAIPEQWYLDRFGIDCVDLARAFSDADADWIPWRLPDGSPALRPSWVPLEFIGDIWLCKNEAGLVLGKMSPGLVYFTQTHHPLAGNETEDFHDLRSLLGDTIWGSVADPAWRHAGRPDFAQLLRQKALELRNTTDYAIMFGIGGNLFEYGQYLYGSEEFLVNLLLEPLKVEKLLDSLLEIHLETIDKVVSAIGDIVDVLVFGDDLGSQNSTLISYDLYRKFIFPRQQTMFSRVHARCPAKVFLHSCGAVSDFIPDLIEAGVDILNPVQLGARGMEAPRLKREFGRDLVFWGGGIDTQHVLATGTPEQVRTEVLRNCEIFNKDGGFVFNQVHNIVEGVSPENIVAMYDAVLCQARI
jgi:uroporphyrinogen decarboxylase